MSALPRQVRKQIEEADRIAKEYQASQQGATPPADGQPPADPDAPPAAGELVASPSPSPEGDASAAGGASTAATPPAPTPLPQEGWEQKYKVLQGKYNAEVPRLQSQVRDQTDEVRRLRDQVTATQNLLASLGPQRGAPASAPAAATPPQPTRLVKDEEVREFGADLIDVMRRVVREEQASLLPEIDRRVAPVVRRVDEVAHATQQVGTRMARADQLSVLEQLDAQVPNWKQLNEDANFLDWLDQTDPYAGVQRGQLLKQAYQAHDGPRVVAFFSGYQKEHAAVSPPAPPAAPASAAAPQKRLEQFVAPGTPKTGTAGTQDGSGKRVWTRDEISGFYSSVQAGRFKGTSEQRKAIEADIFAAQREGRIR